jgi:protein TonB
MNWPSAPPNADLLLGLVATDEASSFDATTVILIGLAATAGYLVYEFIREHRARSGLALFGAVLGHLLFLLFLSLDVPGRLGCNTIEPKRELIEFEVAVVEEEKEEEPPPEPEKEPEPEEPELQPEIQEPPPEPVKPKTKKQPEPDPTPPQPDPAPAKRWDLSQTTQGGNSGVTVQQGSGGEYGGTGKTDSKSKKKGPAGGGDPKGDEDGTVAKWEPRSELFVKDPPVKLKVPEIECPATRELGVEGKVVLRVQVQRDGKVRKVTVVKGIGQGCDEVASKAMKKARFKAAVGTNGQTVDFELTYDYVFTVKN